MPASPPPYTRGGGGALVLRRLQHTTTCLHLLSPPWAHRGFPFHSGNAASCKAGAEKRPFHGTVCFKNQHPNRQKMFCFLNVINFQVWQLEVLPEMVKQVTGIILILRARGDPEMHELWPHSRWDGGSGEVCMDLHAVPPRMVTPNIKSPTDCELGCVL